MKYEITTTHMELSDDLKKYVDKKMKSIARHIPRKAKESAHAMVFLKETTSLKADRFECEINLNLIEDQIFAKEKTINIFAAVDIVEEKIKNQLRKYKARFSKKVDRKSILSVIRQKIDKN